MTSTISKHLELIRRARAGDEKALGQLLDAHRAYLKLLAQRAVGGGLEARADSSDIVQQTCLSAIKYFARFEGDDEAQFVAWLRTIHERNIHKTIRQHVYTKKRAIGKEQSLDDSGAAAPEAVVSSPSQRAMRDERAVQLAAAMSKLPDDQCEAVRLRHLEGCTLAELATRFDRSEEAVAALLKRGLENLRKRLRE